MMHKVSELRWNPVTGIAENPKHQAEADELIALLKSRDLPGLQRFYEERGEAWDCISVEEQSGRAE